MARVIFSLDNPYYVSWLFHSCCVTFCLWKSMVPASTITTTKLSNISGYSLPQINGKVGSKSHPFSFHYLVPVMSNIRANKLADFPSTNQFDHLLPSRSHLYLPHESTSLCPWALGCLSSSDMLGTLQAQPQSPSESGRTSSLLSYTEKIWERKREISMCHTVAQQETWKSLAHLIGQSYGHRYQAIILLGVHQAIRLPWPTYQKKKIKKKETI